jgi:hypothetical protein
MMEKVPEEALAALQDTFKVRIRRPNGMGSGSALASVLPLHAEERETSEYGQF